MSLDLTRAEGMYLTLSQIQMYYDILGGKVAFWGRCMNPSSSQKYHCVLLSSNFLSGLPL